MRPGVFFVVKTIWLSTSPASRGASEIVCSPGASASAAAATLVLPYQVSNPVSGPDLFDWYLHCPSTITW